MTCLVKSMNFETDSSNTPLFVKISGCVSLVCTMFWPTIDWGCLAPVYISDSAATSAWGCLAPGYFSDFCYCRSQAP